MPVSWVSPGTGFMIRDFLLKKGSSYPREVYRYLKERIEAMGYHAPTYKSVRNYFFVLRRLGLIVPTRKVVEQFEKHFYKVAPGKEKDPAWRNPYDALYHPKRFREMARFREVTPSEWLAKIRRELPKRKSPF